MDAKFRSVFIASESGWSEALQRLEKDLQQLKGKRFAFGSESSTSGRLMPQYFLAQAGVTPKDFASVTRALAVAMTPPSRWCKAARIKPVPSGRQVWDSRLGEGKVDTNVVVLLWTPPYADYHWIAEGNLDQRFGAGFTSKLQQSLLTMSPSQPRQKTILSCLQQGGSFRPRMLITPTSRRLVDRSARSADAGAEGCHGLRRERPRLCGLSLSLKAGARCLVGPAARGKAPCSVWPMA